MADINDYISGIVNGISEARQSADTLTVAIAEQYKGNEILSKMSVPRFRISDIDVNLPVSVGTVASQDTFVINRDTTTNAVLDTLAACYKVDSIPVVALTEEEQQEGLAPFSDFLTSVDNYVDNAVSIAKKDKQIYSVKAAISDTIDNYVDHWVSYGERVVEYLSMVEEPEAAEPVGRVIDHEVIRYKVLEATIATFKADKTTKFDFLVTASELNSLDAKAISTIHLKLTEEGMVWSNTENGAVLLPE